MTKSFEVVYSAQKTGFQTGRAYSNPRLFGGKPRAGVTKAIVVGNWPAVVKAYKDAGIEVEVVDAPPVGGRDPMPVKVSKPSGKPVLLPEDWRDMGWKPKQAIATELSGIPAINAGVAHAAIEAALADGRAVIPDVSVRPIAVAVDDMTDDELRAHVEAVTGTKPHHRAGRAKLLEMLEGAE